MILFWKIILQIITIGIVIIVSVLDYVKTDKRTIKFKRFRFTLFVLIFLSIAINIFVVVYDEQSKQQEVSELKQQIALLQQKGDLSNNLLTGGNSYCYYMLSSFGDGTALASVTNNGQYPLYEVNIVITNIKDYQNRLRQQTPLTREDLKSLETVIPIGNMPPNATAMLDTVILPNSDDIRYVVHISSRNGLFTEQLRIKKVDGQWKRAMRIEKDLDANDNPNATPLLLEEFIDNGFPKDENGQIWEQQ